MTTTTKIGIATALAGMLLPVAAFAQGANPNNDNNCLANNGLTNIRSASTTAQVIAAGDCSIALRDTYLDAAQTRVNQMQKVSSSTQASLVATLQSTEATLATIKSTLDADTSTSTAIADYRTIFGNVRVFALVLPRTWIYSTSDREMTISGDLQVVNNELIIKNNSASSTVQTEDAPYLADILTQLTTVNTQSANADTTVQPLVPDQGSTTTRESNTAALNSAQAMLVTGQTAIKAIVADITAIRANLHV